MSILSQVNLNQALTPEEYEERLIRYQVALGQLAYQVYVQKRPVALVFEGWDAAGKGGSDQTSHRAARSARLRRLSDRRARGRGSHAPLPVPLLAAAAGARADRRSSTGAGTAG